MSQQPLGFVSATTLVAASMIGVGVYTTSGFTLAALGTPERVIAAWIVGGLIAICGAIGYGALAARFTESGGEYLFLARALHPVAGLMAGWVSLLAGFTGAIAIAALGLAEYLTPMLPSAFQAIPTGVVASASVIAAAIVHTVGVHGAARLQDVVVSIKLILVGGFIVVAFYAIGDWQGNTAPASNADWSLLVFANQLVWISFSYAGFNAAVYVSSEIRDAERNVPRAIVGGTLLVTVIYVVLNTIFVFAPSASAITDEANIAQVAATAAAAIGGDKFAVLVRIVIVVSLLTSVSALVMTGPRVYAKMADDGFFPQLFRFENQPPVVAIWFQSILAIIAISMTTLKDLLGYLGLTLSICSALTVSMLFVLKIRGDGIRLPLLGIPPAVYVLSTLLLAVLYGIGQPEQFIAAGITVGIGLVLYPWLNRRLPRGPADQDPDD